MQQGGADMSQLKKFAAQNYPGQDGSGQLGDIDEDDEVPGEIQSNAHFQSSQLFAHCTCVDLVDNFDEPSKSEV